MDEKEILFELGDTILLLGGQVDKLRGRIYYIDDELIRVLAEGVSDRLVDIPIVDGDLDPALKIQHLYSVSKRTNPAFVAQISAEVGEKAETFDKNGTPGPTYTITAIDEPTDTITLIDETQAELTIPANFIGIPKDLPFAVLRPRQIVEVEEDSGEIVEEPDDFDAEFEDVLDAELQSDSDDDGVEEIQEVPTSQRIYSDSVQRNDMLQELTSFLDKASQKNPEKLKQIRKLVEQCILLRNAIVQYSPSGEPKGGVHATSMLTINDMLVGGNVPLARPVVKARRVLYLDHTPESVYKILNNNPPTDPTELPGVNVDIRYLDEVVKQTIAYMNTQLGGISSQVLSPDSLPAWYASWEDLNRIFHTTWTVSGDQRPVPFKRDTEFLRYPVIKMKKPSVDGLPPVKVDNTKIVTGDMVSKVSVSVLRGLGPRYNRTRRIESAEEATTFNTLLFPLSEQQYLGATRSGIIAKDIAYSAFQPQTIFDIIERLEGVYNVPTAGGILLVGQEGNTDGSVRIDDWLEHQPLYPLGLADASIELASYGFSDKEFSLEQQEIIIKKIDGYRALIKQYIMELNDRMTKLISEHTITENPFLRGESYETLLKDLQMEPLLGDILKGLNTTTPVYKNSDIAAIAAILRNSVDLFLASVGQIPSNVARERNRSIRREYIGVLQNALEKSEVNALKTYIPEPNTCVHVKDYAIIRKERDLENQMKLFAKFVTRYEGARADNWVNCSVCKEHLVCYHEILLLKEYLHPKEKGEIHKELLLAFSGGVFHGKFICRNCGQVISEIDYDTSIEYSDDGTPISGRAVLEEEPTIKDTLDLILNTGAEEDENSKSEMANLNGDQAIIYTGIKRLFDVVGIYAKPETLRRVLSRVESEMIKQPSASDYKAMTKGKKGVPEYAMFKHRLMVAAISVYVLIEIQTNIPGFVVHYKLPGCRAGFSGFPLGNEKDRTGIEYINCAVATIRDDTNPWNLTGYQSDISSKSRADTIQAFFTNVLTTVLKSGAVQQQISQKRGYLEKVYGSFVNSEQIPEKIPEGFRPLPLLIRKEDASKTPTIPEAATPIERVRGWITLSHQLAAENANVLKGNPLSDASCCVTLIQDPGKFWMDTKGLPPIPEKNPPRGPIDTHIGVSFTPRAYSSLIGTVSPEIKYRIFLKVCYEGPQIGLPHEPGYTNICVHCGFVFPDNPYEITPFPPIGSKELMKTYVEQIETIVTKGKVALQTQGVTVNDDTFETVLDATHRAFRVTPYQPTRPVAGIKLLEMLSNMNPEPFSGWREIMLGTIEKLSKIPAGAGGEIDLADAYGALSEVSSTYMENIRAAIGGTNRDTLQRILEGSVSEAVEAIRTYILIPFQRLATDFQTSSLRINTGLGLGTEEDINENLKQHLQFIGQLANRANGITLSKIKWVIRHLSKAISVLKQNIRSTFIPGGDIGLPYVVAALVGGILANFIDTDFIPEDVDSERLDPGANSPRQILDVCVQKMRKEGLKFTEEHIKELINRRDEIEKNMFIRRFEGMTPEEKAMAKRIKQLGLKEWAIGGTNAIQKYDADQYEVERNQRVEMGFVELFGAEDLGAEGGYDHVQIAEDDY
jgi:hypothetical protein